MVATKDMVVEDGENFDPQQLKEKDTQDHS